MLITKAYKRQSVELNPPTATPPKLFPLAGPLAPSTRLAAPERNALTIT